MSDVSASWLTALVNPRSVALVGASEDPTRIAGRALAYLKRYGFAGGIYPVNPRREVVQGLPSFSCIAAAPTDVDLAVLSVPAHSVIAALQECADHGVKTAIVYASGFAEQDDNGARMQTAISAVARDTGIRVLGPNCLGTIHLATGVTTTFTSALDEGDLVAGPVALLTQSGAFASFVYGAGRRSGVRFGFLGNTGNEADITLSELFREVVELRHINTLLLHIEGVRDPEVFVKAADRARELGKPVVAVKVGNSAVGAIAAKKHTGSDVGSAADYVDLFSRLGVVQVDSMDSLADAGLALQSGKPAPGNRATIVSISGGTGVLMADACNAVGLEVLELPSRVRTKIANVLPPFASTRNPVDVTGAVLDDLESFATVVRECIDEPSTDVLLVAIGNVTTGEQQLTDAILSAASRATKPVFVTWVGGSGGPARRLSAAGIATFTDPTRAVKAAGIAARSAAIRTASHY